MDGCSLRLIKASRKTLYEMLTDRGYIFAHDKNVIINDVELPIHGTQDNAVIFVHYLLKRRQVPSLKECIAKYNITQSDSEKQHIVITSSPVNKTFRTLCKQFNMEHFEILSLGVNITHHKLVPKHILYKSSSNSTLMNNLKTELSLTSFDQLPLMKSTDPVAKYYAAHPGDIFKIERCSKSAGMYTSFRFVIE
jgi:DNA-directed RNA polymerase subunit H (RpoH/RPB5)